MFNYQCEKCSQDFPDLQSMANEIVECQKCKHSVYFIGDLVKEIHDGCILCSNCIYHSLNQGICEFCGKRLTKVEKLELNDHLFAFCAACTKEVARQSLQSGTCCKSMQCIECVNLLRECIKCKKTEIR